MTSTRTGFVRRIVLPVALVVLGLGILPAGTRGAPAVAGTDGPEPSALNHAVQPLELIARARTEPLDRETLRREDEARDEAGAAPRFAVPQPVAITPWSDGTWEEIDDGRFQVWRLRVVSADALSLNFGFDRFRLPKGADLWIYASDLSGPRRHFTDADNEAHGQLWTPVVVSGDVVIELTVPTESLDDFELTLTSINVGYRFFGETDGDKSGTCNIDVVCPEGDDWRDDINTVAVISTGGSLFCSGFMVNNTAEDQDPLFMTANHCSINSGNAASLVVYWNFQSPECGMQGGGSLDDAQTGSTFLAAYTNSDFTLVRLDDAPDPAWDVAYAGWDRGSQNPTSATAIHHPSTDEKSISFEFDPLTTTSYLSTTVPGDGTHLRVTDWDVGTTEPGSSGSPLFDQNHHVVGQLHGGYAACGNDESDWYGRFSVSWNGGGTNSTRLSVWLDPLGTSPQSLELLAPYADGLRVTPLGDLSASGDAGGPFTPASIDYTLENLGSAPLVFTVSKDRPWVDISTTGGTLAVGASTVLTVAIDPYAQSLDEGLYEGTVTILNVTDGLGDTTRKVRLQIGNPGLVFSWTLDTDPGWSTEGLWAFGVPQGAGGQYGNPDPTSGYTGSNVYGYALDGDYENDLPERNLTTGAIDCSQLTAVSVRFHRWLNVEQPAYDHAYLRVSNDGTNWTTVWQNTSEITDAAWTPVEYDISDIADGHATVYLRWTMGTTDSSWRFSGWNLDDVEIWGFQPSVSDVPGRAGIAFMSQNVPNPFNPQTSISFRLTVETRARITIYDARGRLVRTLLDGNVAAGRHEMIWDGTDDDGRAVASGSYLCRLSAGRSSVDRKMTLVR